MVKFESLKSPKFDALTRKQMTAVKGGTATAGGSTVIGTYQVQRPVEQNFNGQRTVGYVTVTVTRIRSWSADDITGGMTCYENEEVCEQSASI